MDLANPALLQFSFFMVFALLGTILSIRLRQPYVVGLLIFGMLAGPNILGLVSDRGIILAFSDLGSILLLFAVGIEFSVSRIIRSGFRAVLITVFKMSILFIFGYELALYFGFDLTSALSVGAMVAITSTAILFKIVTQKGLNKNPVLPLLFSMLIVEDVAAVAALTFFSSLHAAPTFEDKFYSIFISLGMLGAFYMLVRKHAASAFMRLSNSMSAEVMIFMSFSLCLVMSMVASFIGLSPAIGAFLAGSVIASLPNSRSIEKSIKPLLLMFASLFFLSLGMRIDPWLVVSNFWFASSFTLLFAAVCFFSVLALLYATGTAAKNALFGASAMVVLGEFSLLIAATQTDAHAPVILAAGSFGVIVTAILSSFLLDRQGMLLAFGDRAVPQWLRLQMRFLSIYLSGLVKDFSPSGGFWRLSTVCWSCMSGKLVRIAIIAVIMALARFLVGFFGIASGQEALQLRGAILLLGLVPIAALLYGIFRDIHPLLDALSSAIARHKKNSKTENIILRDLAISVGLLFASVSLPDIVSYLQLPSPFNWSDEFCFLLALIFIWDVIRHARELRMKRNK